MFALLPALLALHIAALVLLYISTINSSWWVCYQGQTRDLWRQCQYNETDGEWSCAGIGQSDGEDWLHACQALTVMAVLFSNISLLIFLGQLYTLRKGSIFYATGIFQIFAGLCVMVAALIYTVHVYTIHGAQSVGSFGYSYILAWVSFPLTSCSGVMYLHLRKLE